MRKIVIALILSLLIHASASAQYDDQWVEEQQRLISEGYGTIFDTDAYKNGDYYIREDGRIALGSDPSEEYKILDDGSIWIGSRPTTEEERRELELANSQRQPIYTDLKVSKGCMIEGSIDMIVQSMNGIAQMLNDVGYNFGLLIDTKECTLEFTDYQKGLYTCPINASTGMWVFTDKYLNAEVLQIYGPTDNGKPKKTTYDWAYVASSFACKNKKDQEINDMFLAAWNTGYYSNNDIEFVCGQDPYLDNTWVYIIANK